MTVIQSEQVGDNDQTADGDATAHEVEGEIREFVRRDLSVLRRPRSERSEAAENVNSLIQRVSGASVIEIERVIAELTSVRDMLRSEGERVQREITGYASLSQAAMTSMKIIADSLAQWNPRGAQARHGNG
jgi:hypothetical protein